MGRTHVSLWLILLFSSSLVADSHAARKSVFNPQLSDALQHALGQVRETLKTRNISASLYISDHCYWEGAAGVTRQNPEVPVDSDTFYAFGSITKTFVAGIVLQLVEENKLDLDDPLEKWLPPIPNIDSNITVRQLLNHGGGLGGYMQNRGYRSAIKKDYDRVWSPVDILKYEIPRQDVSPDAHYYTNTNYILLGMIIEAITGDSLSQALQNRIIGPLRLNNTYLPVKGFKPGRWADNTRLFRSRFSSVWAAGAIASVPRDIAKWTQTLHTGKFLQPASLDAMRVTEPRRIGRTELPMGLGVWKLEGENFTAWGHGGRFRPYLSATLHLPELDLSFAYSFNWSESGEQFLPGKQLVDTYLENRPQDISMCFDS